MDQVKSRSAPVPALNLLADGIIADVIIGSGFTSSSVGTVIVITVGDITGTTKDAMTQSGNWLSLRNQTGANGRVLT